MYMSTKISVLSFGTVLLKEKGMLSKPAPGWAAAGSRCSRGS